MSDIIIKAENLGKKYTIGHHTNNGRYTALRDVWMQNARSLWHKAKELVQGKPIIVGDELEEFWALKDVNFEIQRGETVGIIGRNGAGKSTLLKLLSRITEPSAGRVTIRGRVASLLEVGTGFHPELTGRENIYLNGAILGMTRAEIRRKFDEIVAFAEIEKFLDTPVKRYSSGMYVRLAFSVAAHLEPEILLVDEVLAVGDAQFQKKCLGKMDTVSKAGRTVLFVSHNMGSISQLCPKCIWVDQGMIKDAGATRDLIARYLASVLPENLASSLQREEIPSQASQLTEFRVADRNGATRHLFDCDEPVLLSFVYRVYRPVSGLYGYLQINKPDQTAVLVSDSKDCGVNRMGELGPGDHEFQIELPPRSLAPGEYNVYLNFTAPSHIGGNIDSPRVVAGFRLEDNRSVRGNSRGGFFSMLLPWQRIGLNMAMVPEGASEHRLPLANKETEQDA